MARTDRERKADAWATRCHLGNLSNRTLCPCGRCHAWRLEWADAVARYTASVARYRAKDTARRAHRTTDDDRPSRSG